MGEILGKITSVKSTPRKKTMQENLFFQDHEEEEVDTVILDQREIFLDTINALTRPVGNKKAKKETQALAISDSRRKAQAKAIADCAKANAKKNEILRDRERLDLFKEYMNGEDAQLYKDFVRLRKKEALLDLQKRVKWKELKSSVPKTTSMHIPEPEKTGGIPDGVIPSDSFAIPDSLTAK
jgi:hypothetical protein